MNKSDHVKPMFLHEFIIEYSGRFSVVFLSHSSHMPG
jgi:hypothetical protein